jgi:6,7-dimethyl-8-ribityllumazine synthase
MQISDRTYSTPLKKKSTRIAVVTALFNDNITRALTAAAVAELKKLGVEESRIMQLEVPGAWELPLAAARIFTERKADAVIAVGCVIRGDTGHYEIVANESARGLMQVSLDSRHPVMNAVLTVENRAQAEARSRADETNKGAEAARSLVELLNNLADL